MKPFLNLFFVFTLATSFAQTPSNSIVIGKVDSLYSRILNEERKVYVYVPEAVNGLYIKSKYPVVYLLDGESHFHSVTGMIQQLSQVNGNTIVPEMIVVGITNTNRDRDLTSSLDSIAPYMDPMMAKTTGGGENFTAFIQKELIPHIDSLYPTLPYRVLIGHSLGGLMVVNTLINHPEIFNSYIAIEPSIWWDNQKLLKQAEKDLATKKFEGKTLFLAMANTLQPDLDTNLIRKDTTFDSKHLRSIIQLSDALKKNPQNHLQWTWKYYKDDDHSSVPLIAEHDALRYIFSFNRFHFPSADELKTLDIDSALTQHYLNISQHMGYTVKPPEMMVNQIGYFYLQQNLLTLANGLFQMNIDNYPESFNVYDSMGDCYYAAGEKQLAITFYKKALSIFENQDTRVKLEKVMKEN